MSKAHRGTGIRKEPNHGRGTCPVCGKTQIKILYDQDVDGKSGYFKAEAFRQKMPTLWICWWF